MPFPLLIGWQPLPSGLLLPAKRKQKCTTNSVVELGWFSPLETMPSWIICVSYPPIWPSNLFFDSLNKENDNKNKFLYEEFGRAKRPRHARMARRKNSLRGNPRLWGVLICWGGDCGSGGCSISGIWETAWGHTKLISAHQQVVVLKEQQYMHLCPKATTYLPVLGGVQAWTYERKAALDRGGTPWVRMLCGFVMGFSQ